MNVNKNTFIVYNGVYFVSVFLICGFLGTIALYWRAKSLALFVSIIAVQCDFLLIVMSKTAPFVHG